MAYEQELIAELKRSTEVAVLLRMIDPCFSLCCPWPGCRKIATFRGTNSVCVGHKREGQFELTDASLRRRLAKLMGMET
jgi:hypothetical protein